MIKNSLEFKGTKGAWKVIHEGENFHVYAPSYFRNGIKIDMPICENVGGYKYVGCPERWKGIEVYANACLIAQSPELLRLLECVQEMNPELPTGMMEDIDDALFVAKGGHK